MNKQIKIDFELDEDTEIVQFFYEYDNETYSGTYSLIDGFQFDSDNHVFEMQMMKVISQVMFQAMLAGFRTSNSYTDIDNMNPKYSIN